MCDDEPLPSGSAHAPGESLLGHEMVAGDFGLRAARQTERSARVQKKSEAWKIWVAHELKRRTNAPNAWIAKQLHMGVSQAVSVHVGRFASKGGDASEAYQKFIQKFTK